MRGWLLDTNVIASLIAPNGAPSVKAWAQKADEGQFYLSIITLAEYDKGIANLAEHHPSRARHIATRDAIEMRFSGRIVPLSNAVVRRWGKISGETKRITGHPPPVIDTMMAASAIEANLYLVTRNIKDVASSGATVFNPWTDEAEAFPLSPMKPRIK